MSQLKTPKKKVDLDNSRIKLYDVLKKRNKMNLNYLAKFESELDLYIEEIFVHPQVQFQNGQ